MKFSIRIYCNEGYDVLIVVDMRNVLIEYLVKGIIVAVSVVKELEKLFLVNKIE